MKHIQAIFFDLDGTLVNSLADLAGACNTVLTEAGYPVHPVEDYRYFVGNGAEVLLRRALPEGEADRLGARLTELGTRFGEVYNSRWSLESRAYAGMPETLAELNRRGIPIAVVTNKQQEWAVPFVHQFYPDVTFAEIRGLSAATPPKPAPEGVWAVASQLGVEPARCLFLGDTNVDMKTAVNSGCIPVGVLWGFRTRNELVQSGARELLDTPGGLLTLLEQIENRG